MAFNVTWKLKAYLNLSSCHDGSLNGHLNLSDIKFPDMLLTFSPAHALWHRSAAWVSRAALRPSDSVTLSHVHCTHKQTTVGMCCLPGVAAATLQACLRTCAIFVWPKTRIFKNPDLQTVGKLYRRLSSSSVNNLTKISIDLYSLTVSSYSPPLEPSLDVYFYLAFWL